MAKTYNCGAQIKIYLCTWDIQYILILAVWRAPFIT